MVSSQKYMFLLLMAIFMKYKEIQQLTFLKQQFHLSPIKLEPSQLMIQLNIS